MWSDVPRYSQLIWSRNRGCYRARPFLFSGRYRYRTIRHVWVTSLVNSSYELQNIDRCPGTRADASELRDALQTPYKRRMGAGTLARMAGGMGAGEKQRASRL